jgi:hypothetical protein
MERDSHTKKHTEICQEKGLTGTREKGSTLLDEEQEATKEVKSIEEASRLTKAEVADAIREALKIRTEMGRRIVDVALECIELFETKQRDYGSKNISLSGEMGIAVRLQDKVCRMRHLLESGGEVNHESLADTYKDVANYGMIGYNLNQGRWE